jgi:hypothetical protein
MLMFTDERICPMIIGMTRANSLLEVSPSELRIGTHSHPVNHRVARKASDEDLLEAYLDFVRSLRNSAGNVWLRNDDLEVLSAVLGWTSDAVRADLEGRMTVRKIAKQKQHKRRRVVFAAYGIAIVGSALVAGSYVQHSNAGTGNSLKVGSALTIEQLDTGTRTIEAAGSTSSKSGARVGDAQTITQD